MTSASSLAFPGSRTLATWWRHLAPFRPQGLWVGYLFLHRLEAAACWLEPQTLDPLLVVMLEALVLEQKRGILPADLLYDRLHQRLGLDVPIVRRLAHSLAQRQLLASQIPASGPGLSWVVTDDGQAALRTKTVWARRWRRGTFPFVERLGSNGQRLAPPHYLKILDGPSSSWIVHDQATFTAGWLHACIEQTSEWKRIFGFPLGVAAFAALPGAEALVPWDHVVLDRTERLLIAFLQGPKPEEELIGFGVRPEGWVLSTAEPILQLPAAACSVLWQPPESQPLADWQNAWLMWCQTRNVPLALGHDCALTLVDKRLRIAAPERLIHYLQAARSDVFRGESWLCAGEGYVRQAARLEVVAR